MMKLSLAFMVLSILLMVATLPTASLQVGFYLPHALQQRPLYKKLSPRSEAVFQNPGIAAGLIRLHFHDCFIRGCDGSILLDSTPGNPTEKESPANNPSLPGFEVIDKAKAEIEAQCPHTVSCADIVAFAARDGALRVGGINYAVPAERRDGTISLESDVFQNLPAPFFLVDQLQQNFACKGLSLDEMVTLSGAHSVGVSHCSSFANRLYSFNATNPQDPSMNRAFAAYLKTKCSAGSNQDGTVPLDIVSPNRLDNPYYKNLRNHKGLLTSDQTLWTETSTAPTVRYNANHRAEWAAKFAAAMVHMGSIEVLTGTQGEIRTNCRVVN